jgi:membrane protein implicated in regulation of membrane protease activity
MSNLSRAILTMVVFLVGLAGLTLVASVLGGYHFGFTLLVVVGAYVAILLVYVCYRRIKHHAADRATRQRNDSDCDATRH